MRRQHLSISLITQPLISRETLFPYFSIISAALPVGARSDLVRQGTNRPLYCLIRHKVERGVGEGVIKQLQVNSAKHTSLDSEFGRKLPVGRRWEFIYVMKGFILRPRRSLRRMDGPTHFLCSSPPRPFPSFWSGVIWCVHTSPVRHKANK